MSIDAKSELYQQSACPAGVRFRPRDEPPEPLFGPPNVNYPARDGRPMADNTLQDQWMDRIKGGLSTLFLEDPDVFVASNLMWYPVEERNRRRLAPDVMVALGRPKGYRLSYVCHHEGPAVLVFFEILSPGNRKRVMDYKRKIYEMYGVEEYYVFDPYKITLEVWLREGDAFVLVPEASGFVSPRLGIRFELGEDMTIFAPDGRPFLDHAEIARERDESERRARQSERQFRQSERRSRQAEQQAETARQRAGQAEQQAETERQRAEAERQRAEAERQRAERLAAKLRELGLEPEE